MIIPPVSCKLTELPLLRCLRCIVSAEGMFRSERSLREILTARVILERVFQTRERKQLCFSTTLTTSFPILLHSTY